MQGGPGGGAFGAGPPGAPMGGPFGPGGGGGLPPGLNAGDFMKLRPCPVWIGGPDAQGGTPKGAWSYRKYLKELQLWVATGIKCGVGLGIMASEMQARLPERPKKLLFRPMMVPLLDGKFLQNVQTDDVSMYPEPCQATK